MMQALRGCRAKARRYSRELRQPRQRQVDLRDIAGNAIVLHPAEKTRLEMHGIDQPKKGSSRAGGVWGIGAPSNNGVQLTPFGIL